MDSGLILPFWLRNRAKEILLMAVVPVQASLARASLPPSLPDPLYNCMCNTAEFAGCVKKVLVQGISKFLNTYSGRSATVNRVGEPCQDMLAALA